MSQQREIVVVQYCLVQKSVFISSNHLPKTAQLEYKLINNWKKDEKRREIKENK
jgi:hypothetical protein